MKRIILISSIVVFTTSYSLSQQFEEVGAGVLDFLLENPKTADKMKPSEGVALNIISDFLKTQGQRKHEIEYANAGRDQITINTNDGRQAQFVKDGSGNMFLVVEGVIYPIAQELINQASNISNTDNATLPPYNLGDLESKFNQNPKENLSQSYIVQKGGEYLSDIAKKFNVPESNIWRRVELLDGSHKLVPLERKIIENKKKVRQFFVSDWDHLWIIKEKYKNEISTVFSYKWHQDLNGNGSFSFNEFKQIKRTFYNDEDFNIAIYYLTEKDFKGNLEIKFFEDYSGKLIYKKEKLAFSGLHIDCETSIPAGTLPAGVYLINVNLIRANSNALSSKSEKFEIIKKE